MGFHLRHLGFHLQSQSMAPFGVCHRRKFTMGMLISKTCQTDPVAVSEKR
jgi:hypothetical protein